jgi:DNA-binding GntR family transcriptional regulator
MVESRSAAAAAELKRRIVQGNIAPGARLSERAISQGLNVSRTPLREALLQLESERLVERTSSGAWQAKRLTERDVRDIFAVRRQLEVLAVRLTIERASDLEVAGLEEFLVASELAHDSLDLLSMTLANGGFHSAVYRITHSSWLTTAMEPIRSQTIRIRFLIASHISAPEYPESHRQIYDALVRRNVRTAEAIVTDHVEDDLKVAVRHLGLLTGPPEVFYYDKDDLAAPYLAPVLAPATAAPADTTTEKPASR